MENIEVIEDLMLEIFNYASGILGKTDIRHDIVKFDDYDYNFYVSPDRQLFSVESKRADGFTFWQVNLYISYTHSGARGFTKLGVESGVLNGVLPEINPIIALQSALSDIKTRLPFKPIKEVL